MYRQLKMMCLFMALWLVFMPIGSAMAQVSGQAAGAVTLPIAGTVVAAGTTTSIGQFNGSFTINSFARTPFGQITASGMVRGVITNSAGQTLLTGLQRVVLPVVLSQLSAGNMQAPLSTGPRMVPASFRPMGNARLMRVQFGCGGSLRVAMGGGAAVNIMGSSVMLSPFNLDVAADTGGILGGLVCQIVGMIGGFLDPSSLLNSVLGTLTGLLGGATGGLLGGIL